MHDEMQCFMVSPSVLSCQCGHTKIIARWDSVLLIKHRQSMREKAFFGRVTSGGPGIHGGKGGKPAASASASEILTLRMAGPVYVQ